MRSRGWYGGSRGRDLPFQFRDDESVYLARPQALDALADGVGRGWDPSCAIRATSASASLGYASRILSSTSTKKCRKVRLDPRKLSEETALAASSLRRATAEKRPNDLLDRDLEASD